MAPLVIPEEYLLKDTKSNRKEIRKLITERIELNKKLFPNWKNNKTLLRIGIPKPFMLGNKVVSIGSVNEYGRSGKGLSLKTVTDKHKVREALLRAMTDETGAATKTAYGRGARKLFKNQEDHHIIFRNLLDNFYENLDTDDAAELTAHLARRGSPAGNVIENLQGIDIDLHDSKMPGSLHQWARNMGIDSKSFPDLTNLDLDARTAAIDDWLDLIEEPLLDRTATTLSRQDYRRWGTDGLPKPTKGFKDRPNAISKSAWKEYLINQRENVKARANLLDKYPILAEDLDTPNIRPELKERYEKALALVPEEDLKTFKALTSEQDKHALAWFNDRDYRKTIGKPIGETTELGRPLGGIGNKIQVGSGLRRADQALLLGTNIATGNIAGAGVQAGTIAATEAMKTRVVQKAFAKQVAALTAKRGAKSALKLIPGVDIGISAKESWDYAMQGKFDQAAIAAASGAVGWVPGVGDAASAGLDIMNTGIDISRLHIRSKNKNRNKIQNVDAPRRWLKFKP